MNLLAKCQQMSSGVPEFMAKKRSRGHPNIDPIFHNQYHKMNNLTWEDYGEKYDLKSIMHYEGWAFAKAGFK